ncbi:hypothetical protein PSENEW3n2_00000616 [Picochlorum sp. SENEW3]|nr:hypothetical protein PSENEW3n2_00000616 [Picochlorum sp. SENEW3]WPT15536.1 hypothetical protein PSENEW3_00000616 [Picochlorum sp. SENEW3]
MDKWKEQHEVRNHAPLEDAVNFTASYPVGDRCLIKLFDKLQQCHGHGCHERTQTWPAPMHGKTKMASLRSA